MKQQNRITSDSVADLIFHLKWKSGEAVHTDAYQANRVNIWRDRLPPMLSETLMGKEAGERFRVSLEDGEAVAAFTPKNLMDIQRTRFRNRSGTDQMAEPRLGRFYPKGLLQGISGIFKANVQPFRCIGLSNGHMTADLNHPLAGKDLELAVVVGKVGHKSDERGGTSVAWMESLTSGPGMQARWQRQQTDYLSDGALSRDDNHPDAEFYHKPRLVQHIDDSAREMVSNTYGRFLTDGMRVLDLMSSWQSHIPPRLHLDRLTGLGLNQEELKRNSQLSDFVVHDLNADAVLPFDSGTFDAVLNTVSIEYLIDPLAVLKEVSRILRPEGYFIVTFSNRWFPTKAVKVWKEIHEFERMGLVLEYFLRTGGFKDLQTYSIRGLPRPHHDKYFPDLLYSDPVYAVWGRKR